jgi:type IV pilus assembly protein PilE
LIRCSGTGGSGVIRARKNGFTLVEMVIALVIVALLLALTLPAYQLQLRKTRRSLGNAELMQVMLRQEQYFLEHKQYAQALTHLGYPTSPYAISAQGNAVPVMSDDRIYLIDLAARQDRYTLYAIPQLTQAADRICGTLGLDSTGIKSATGEGAARDCW